MVVLIVAVLALLVICPVLGLEVEGDRGESKGDLGKCQI